MFSRRNRFSILLPAALAAAVVLSLLVLPLAAGAQAVANGISSPANGATVSGTVEVKGFASDPNFVKWQLDLLPGGNANAPIFLAFGTTPGAFTFALDTTVWPKGEHALRLRVVRADSNYTEYITKFTIGAAAAAAPGAKAPAVPAATKPVTPTVTARATVTPTVSARATATPAASAAANVNGISSPANGATVSGNVTIQGFANDPRFEKWQLDLLPAGNANAPIFLALGVAPGVFTSTLNTANFPQGEHALRLRVVRTDSNYTEYVTKFTIGAAAAPAARATPAAPAATRPVSPTVTARATVTPTVSARATATPAAAAAAVNGISSPANGATLNGTVEVKGFANDPNFAKWQLDLLPGGNANAPIFLAFGTTPGAFTFTLDAAGLPKGEHALRLRVVRTDSNYTEYITKFTR